MHDLAGRRQETETQSQGLKEEILREQSFVDQAYSVLESLRSEYRRAQRDIESQGAWGSPQARTERDAKAAHFGDQASRLEQIEDRLVFGRIDNRDGKSHYIGRAGLPESGGSRLLVDWRAPAARPFYQATAASPGDVVRRRHISTHLRQVRGIEDDVLDASAASKRGLSFQGEGALMSALASARDGRMGDIVATIQAEQDSIIRADSDGVMVVQGGPGTGKTAVALHRAAYLLYTHRERLERTGVLVVGPSRVFLRYIEQVLPSLGESGVVSVTMGSLVPGINAQIQDSADVARAKGRIEWIETLRSAVRDLQRIPREAKTFVIDGKIATLTPSMVKEAQVRARRSGRPHNVARDSFALELVDQLTRQLAGDDSDAETLDWWRESVRSSRDIRREINLCWMPTTSMTLLERLYAKPELLRRIARGISEKDLAVVHRPIGSPLTTSDIPLIDELEELLGSSEALQNVERAAERKREEDELERVRDAIRGQHLGGGIVSAEMLAEHARGPREWVPLSERALADRTWVYGHVVVDEAQDLSPMAWHSLLRRCPARSFTVVGDLDQARGRHTPSSWYQALGPAARGLSDERSLSISYRTPKTITELAQDVLSELGHPVLFPLTSARDVPHALADTLVIDGGNPAVPKERDPLWAETERVVEQERQRLEAEVGPEAGRIGILVGNDRASAWGADSGANALDQQISLLSVVGAKGLEFDITIVVEPMEIAKDGPGDLFVAMTRSTRRLHSVRSDTLPSVWLTALEANR